MIIGSLLVLTVGYATVPPTVFQAPDTLGAIRQVRDAIGRYLAREGIGPRAGRTDTFWEDYGNYLGWRCSPDEGAESCMGGDWVKQLCPADTYCHPPTDDLEDLLLRSAREHPESGYLTGQAVFNLARFGRPLEAMEVAQGCEASEGWCGALEGHVLHSVGRVLESEPFFRDFLDSAPDSVACRYRDATWLLGSWSWMQVRRDPHPPKVWTSWAERPCEERMAISDTLWWLADPLYIVEGNDRWAEHIDRMLIARWVNEIADAGSRPSWSAGNWRDMRWASYARRGPWDSFQWERSPPRTGMQAVWTSQKAARYHFIPDFAGVGFSNPTWRLVGDIDDEGYTPPYGAFHLLPIQIARFRESTPEPERSSSDSPISMRYAVAGTVVGSPIADAASSAYLILTDAPESFPLQLEAPFSEGRAVFLASAPPKRYVASLEVLTEAGIGWHREMVEPLNTEGPGISDLLLYQPVGRSEPDSLMAAAASMLGSTELEDVGQLGIYWEVYGAEAEIPLEFQLRLEKEGGGLVDRLRRLLPGGEEEVTSTLGWTEPGEGWVTSKALVLGLDDLDPGRYTVVLGVTWTGQEEALERRRELVVR